MNFSKYTTKTQDEIFEELNVSEKGLTASDAAQRLERYGLNVVEAASTHWWEILLRQFKSPFIFLLIAAALLTFFLRESIDGVMIILFVTINAALGFYQEYRSEQTLELLKQYTVPQIKVRRDGKEVIIKSQELVPGDIVLVEPGSIVPADVRFIKTYNLLIDESILTGESVPVKKYENLLPQQETEIYKAQNIGFSGTSIVGGKGVGVIFASGKNTSIGEITRLTVETKHESSFEKGIAQFSTFILRLVLITLLLLFIINLYIKGLSADVVSLAIFSIALAVSVIPEALPVVTTFSLSRGALRLAKHKVVVKRLSAIEDLGSIEVLCSDKTGTLTENKLRVDEVYSHEENEKDTLLYANLASGAVEGKKDQFIEPFDVALWDNLPPSLRGEITMYERVGENPFDPTRRRNSVLVRRDNQYILIVRGAPESILDLSTNIGTSDKEKHMKWMSEKGEKGLRVIGVAKKEMGKKPVNQLSEKDEEGLFFLGLVSFVDPLKETASGAIKRAEELGIVIKILTGDSPEVAGFVAAKTGLTASNTNVITGDEFNKLTVDKQQEAVEKFSVFARVSPEQKYKIVQLLQKQYEVGFLGEGINDAPALKIANVGLVVQSAADVSREAADIVLLQKSLNVIVDGIKEGREVFANTIKYIRATLSSNFGNFYAIAIASLVIDYLPMLPLQILLVNLLTDFPMISIATDNVDPNEIKKPRNYGIHEIAFLATILGLVSTVFDFIFFGLFYRTPSILQTNWFIGSVLTELVFLYSIRTKLFVLKAKQPSKTVILLTVIAFLVTVGLPFTSIGHGLFGFRKPTELDLVTIFGIVAFYFMITEVVKLLYYSRAQSSFSGQRRTAS